jgi:hypothetical protein
VPTKGCYQQRILIFKWFMNIMAIVAGRAVMPGLTNMDFHL